MRLRFSHTFTVSGAPVAFAFTFPYSYQQLQSDLDAISKQHGAGRPEERLFGCSMRSTAQGQGRWSARCSPSADGALECGEAEQLEAAVTALLQVPHVCCCHSRPLDPRVA